MDECTIQVDSEKLIYNGTAQTPGVTITYEGKALTEGQDYTLSYEKNTDAGMANVVIQGKGIYTGEAYKTFEITRADASVSVSSKTVTMGKKKMALADWMTTDGKVTYKSSDSKTVKISGNQFIALKPGKAVITISAKQGQELQCTAGYKGYYYSQTAEYYGGCPEISQKGSGKSILEACEIHQWIPDPVQQFC